jgi:L-glyceraldehyde 3-phosphate reductase
VQWLDKAAEASLKSRPLLFPSMPYDAAPTRYDQAAFFARCGRSGLLLPRISLGLWHNFGGVDQFETGRAIVRRAFDLGVTHFDLANNYGPPPGSAEENFGKLLALDLAPYRDELIISTKAGYRMWPGPYGEWGSRKYLLASLDASLRRLGLDYVDIFYSHRPDPNTPLEETMGALATAVKSGKALYVGLSNYDAPTTARAAKILRELGVPTLAAEGMGCIPFSPLAQGLLTNRYLAGIPTDARAGKAHGFLKADRITPEVLAKVQKLGALAQERGQSLAQLALAWVLRDARVTTALIGASKISQLEDCVGAAANTPFSAAELATIEAILG